MFIAVILDARNFWVHPLVIQYSPFSLKWVYGYIIGCQHLKKKTLITKFDHCLIEETLAMASPGRHVFLILITHWFSADIFVCSYVLPIILNVVNEKPIVGPF